MTQANGTNGHAHPAPDGHAVETQLREARARLRLKRTQCRLLAYEAAERRQRRLAESAEFPAGWLSGWSDVVDRFGSDRDLAYPFSTAMDRRYGANWPFWRTWQEHARLRAASRLLWGMSPYAFGAVGALSSYVVGEGMRAKATAKVPGCPPELVAAVQSLLDDFEDANDFLTAQQEYFVRSRRDGEAILRLWPQDDGMTLVKPVEPEQVVEPPGRTLEEASFGVGVDPDDVTDTRYLWVSYSGVHSQGEEVPASLLAFTRENVDSTIKRGMPDFAFDGQQLLKTAGRLIRNLGEGSAIQAAISFIRQHSVAPGAAVEDFVNVIGELTETRPVSGRPQSVQRFDPGTVLDIDKGQEYLPPPGAEHAASHLQVVQGLLRAVAVRWNAPEWIISADASNNSYSSSLTAEAPFVKKCKAFQGRYARTFRAVLLAFLRHHCLRRGGVRAGRNRYDWRTVSRLVDVSVTPPTVETRNRGEEAQLNRTYVELGVKSRQTVAQEQGLDWRTEERNNEEYEKKHGDQGVPKEMQAGGPAEGMPPPGRGQGPAGPEQGPGQGPNGRPASGQGGPPSPDDTSELERFLDSLTESELADPGVRTLLEGLHARLLEKGYTGRTVDRLNRARCYVDGKPVPCAAGAHAQAAGGKDGDLEAARERLSRVLSSPQSATSDELHALAASLTLLSASEVEALRKEHGIRAGGAKPELIRRVVAEASRVLDLRRAYERKARAAGVPPAYVTGLAREQHGRALAWAKEGRSLVMAARQYYRSLTGGKTLSRNLPAFRDGKGPSAVPELELIARGLKGRFPAMLNGRDETEDAATLYDLLMAGGPPLPGREEAYKQALERAVEERKKNLDEVPFDIDGLTGWEREFAGEPEFLRPPEGEEIEPEIGPGIGRNEPEIRPEEPEAEPETSPSGVTSGVTDHGQPVARGRHPRGAAASTTVIGSVEGMVSPDEHTTWRYTFSAPDTPYPGPVYPNEVDGQFEAEAVEAALEAARRFWTDTGKDAAAIRKMDGIDVPADGARAKRVHMTTVYTMDERNAGAGSGGYGRVSSAKVFWWPYSAKDRRDRMMSPNGSDMTRSLGVDPMYVLAHELHHAYGFDSEFDKSSDVAGVMAHLMTGLRHNPSAPADWLQSTTLMVRAAARGTKKYREESSRMLVYLNDRFPAEMRRLATEFSHYTDKEWDAFLDAAYANLKRKRPNASAEQRGGPDGKTGKGSAPVGDGTPHAGGGAGRGDAAGGGTAGGERPEGSGVGPREAAAGGGGVTGGVTPPEPLFTGTDALGREWVNGRLVAAKGEAPAGGGSPSPDVTPPAPEPAPEPKDAGETRKDAAPAAGPDAEAWLARQSQAMEPTSEQVADATRTFKALRKGTYSPAAAAGQATAARDAARQALTDAYLAQQAAQQNLERAHRVFASGLMPHDAHSRAADKARRAAEAIDAAFKAYREKEAWRRAVASRHPELFAPAVPAPAPPDTPTATAPATAPPAKPLTTAQAAKHLNVAPRTVSKWAAMGKLKATREEGTNNRLIAPADLAAFMREHGFEVPAGLEGGEPPSPDVAGPRQPAAPPADAAPQPDGTRKAKDGTVWAKAPAGGAVSPVNGQSYKGGQWMPIHGLSEPKKAGKGDGLGDAPKPPDEDAEAKGKRQPRRPMSPEDVEAERGRREAQAAWDEIKAGPLGRMKWTGDSPNRKAVADERIDLKGWQEFAERIGPEGVARVAAAVEPVVHAGIGRFAADARAKQTPGNEAAFGGIPDDLERYEREQVKRRAEEDVSQGRTNKAHEKRVPGSHYARQLVQAALFNMGQPSLEVMREVNRLLAGAERGPDATPAGPDTAGGGPDTAPKPPSPGFTGKDATGHCWEDGRVVPCPDETPAGPAAAPAASSPPGVPPEADAGPDSPPPGATPSAPELPDASPREQADADALAARASAEYAFARESAVPNVGEDVGGSARHVRNQWKGLDDAEREGTAEALVTRDNLFRNEPPALLANVAPANALASLAAHLALSAFPPDPGLSYASRDPRHSPEERRRQYYEAYRAVKAAAEGAAAEEADPFKALARVNAAVAGEVRRLRQQAGEGYMAQVSAKDRYNPVANALVETLNRTRVQPSPRYYKKTDVGTRLLDFAARVKGAYGEVTPETLGRVAEHVKDVMEGDSFNKTFGTVQAGKKTFTPADLYVKHAVRKGGPVIDAATVKAGIDHLTKVQGMRAVQWGNSVTDDERQHHLARTAEAFADLTDVLGLPPDMASLGGELALAIGARGKGSAMAHYEPDVKVINLTRKNGVGSLAHEWGHFLDHLLAAGGLTGTGDKVKADFMSGQASARRFVKARPGERANAYGIRVDEHGRMATEDVSSDPVWSAMDGVRSAMRDSGFDARCRSATSDAVRDGRLPKSRYEYWNSVEERFARSFERYVQHRLHEADRENTYLSGVEPHDFWPNEDEVRAMAPAFDRLMAAAGEWFGKRQAGKPG